MTNTGTTPEVSIIVPNYNHVHFLPERIASIRSQSFQKYELMVLDDASSDYSLDVPTDKLKGVPHKLSISELNSDSSHRQ
jgi:GT2 family glycosyltransferase